MTGRPSQRRTPSRGGGRASRARRAAAPRSSAPTAASGPTARSKNAPGVEQVLGVRRDELFAIPGEVGGASSGRSNDARRRVDRARPRSSSIWVAAAQPRGGDGSGRDPVTRRHVEDEQLEAWAARATLTAANASAARSPPRGGRPGSRGRRGRGPGGPHGDVVIAQRHTWPAPEVRRRCDARPGPRGRAARRPPDAVQDASLDVGPGGASLGTRRSPPRRSRGRHRDGYAAERGVAGEVEQLGVGEVVDRDPGTLAARHSRAPSTWWP